MLVLADATEHELQAVQKVKADIHNFFKHPDTLSEEEADRIKAALKDLKERMKGKRRGKS